MENHTKRIRKARRQGLASRNEQPQPERVTGRRGVTRSPTRGLDLPAEPSPRERKKETTTTRKAERAARSTTTKKIVARSTRRVQQMPKGLA